MNSKYKSLKEFRDKNPSAYNAISRAGELEEYCRLLGWKLRIIWTKQLCLNEAIKYNTVKLWQIKSQSSYNAAKKNGWFNECTKHMITTRKPAGFYDIKKNVIKEAKKYSNIKQWQIGGSASYQGAKRNGWFEECIKHMNKLLRPVGFWTFEKCKEDALKYTGKWEWQKKSVSAYNAAFKNKWIDKCTKHMVSSQRGYKYWDDYKNCKKACLSCKQLKELRQKFLACDIAIKRNGWFEELTKHMIKRKIYTLSMCKEEALNYKKRTEWKKNNLGLYESARRNGWLNECCIHMK